MVLVQQGHLLSKAISGMIKKKQCSREKEITDDTGNIQCLAPRKPVVFLKC
jgi:hypothetical protein